MTRWLDPDEQRTWRAYLTASRALMDTLDRELQRDAGMPHAYYEILVRLSEAPGRRLRMSELADADRLVAQPALARGGPAGGGRLGAPRGVPHRPARADRRAHRRRVSPPSPPPRPATSRGYAGTCSTRSARPRSTSCAGSARRWPTT